MADEPDTEETRLAMVQELRSAVEFGNAGLYDRMRRASNMTYGDQWEPGDREHRTRKNKFCLSVPLIKAQIKQVVGQQVQNPKELTVIANRAGTKTGANILTKVAKHALDAEYNRFQKTHWIEAGLANTVGFLGVFVDFNQDPKNGNLRVEKVNEFECGIDPNCSVYDFNSFHQGAKCFIWEPWVDKDLIKAEYPDVTDIQDSNAKMDTRDPTGIIGWLGGMKRSIIRRVSSQYTEQTDTLEKYKYRVTHTWYRKAKRVVMLYDNEANELDAELFIKDAEIKKAKQLAKDQPDRYEVEDVVRNIMQHHIRVGSTVLDEIEDELNGVDMYPVVAFSPYFDNGYRGGMSEDLIGTQQEINFTHSTTMDLLKKLPNTGWKIASDTGGYAAELEEKGSQDGVVLELDRAGGTIDKIIGTEPPKSLERFEERSIRNISLISGVRTETPQSDKAQLSGRAILAKQTASLTGNSPIHLNFDYSQMILNNLVIEIVRANGIYSEDEILEIVGTDEMIDAEMMDQARAIVAEELRKGGREVPTEPPQLDPELAQLNPAYVANYLSDVESVRQARELIDQVAAPIARELLINQISDLKKGRYNTTIASTAYTPSMRTAEFDQLLAIQKMLVEMGSPPIPARRLILATDARDAEQIVVEMEQAQQAQQTQQQSIAG